MQNWLQLPDLTPHGFCLAWEPALLRLHVVSDALIAVSYYSIPVALAYFVLRRRDLVFSWVFLLFALFILACGTTHVLDIWTLWHADYLAQGVVKGVTAAASVLTATLLWPLIPKALSLPSPALLHQANAQLLREIRQKEDAFDALHREQADRERAEAMLRQSQKMEAVGQLTGGVAHDFNNLLLVIQGSLEALEEDAADPGAARHIARALRSVQQGSTLTRQLLAFARQQPLQPITFDMNERVRGLVDLLSTTVGQQIAMTLALEPALWSARADPHHLDSALLNLVINARDAMPEGGALAIRTRNVTLTFAEAAQRGGAPGDYVAVSVEDTGTGMTPEVREMAFEPFFTTKPAGRGTGLGLSQIYGFVRQSEGLVTLDSAVGHGTTVTIFLHRAAAEVLSPQPIPAG